jgi:hypothetical protein
MAQPNGRPDVVVIPCAGRKLERRAAARDLYSPSQYFRACLAYAESTGARVLILSALHGLIELEEELAPYELRMGAPGAVDSFPALLRAQARVLQLHDAESVQLVGGRDYVAAARAVWPDATSLFDDLEHGRRGIGYQLGYLKALTATEAAA